uniref:Uncharacterized protein n=1 Tax=Cacopsylla melanoneura TaxID=428564 RepID=A0A8D9ATS1_9HEMI
MSVNTSKFSSSSILKDSSSSSIVSSALSHEVSSLFISILFSTISVAFPSTLPLLVSVIVKFFACLWALFVSVLAPLTSSFSFLFSSTLVLIFFVCSLFPFTFSFLSLPLNAAR